jgi:hypothetical protein
MSSNKFSTIVFVFFTIFFIGCTHTPNWILGKWKPGQGTGDTISAETVSTNRIGYEIRENTLFGYTSKDYESSPVQLMLKPRTDPFKLEFVKRSEAKFKIKSYSETQCQIELLSGNELKFGHRGWAFVSDVVPGTTITFKKLGYGIVYERNFIAKSNKSPQTNDKLREQQEFYIMLGNTDGGVYKMKLFNDSFNVDNSLDFSKKK